MIMEEIFCLFDKKYILDAPEPRSGLQIIKDPVLYDPCVYSVGQLHPVAHKTAGLREARGKSLDQFREIIAVFLHINPGSANPSRQNLPH